jgi:hypothetical protein
VADIEEAEQPQSLRLADIMGYLIGRRSSIERVAADSNSIWYGLAFVVTAGFCREYDQEVLATQWHIYLAPIAASLVMASWNYIWLFCYYRGIPEMVSYRTFLGLFWMTAPCAWVYALPVERWYEPLTAIHINMSLLAVVAIWRGVVFCRALTHLCGRSMYALIIASAAVLIVPVSLFASIGKVVGLMAGGQFSPEQQAIRDFSEGVVIVTFWGGVLSLGILTWQISRRHVGEWRSLGPSVHTSLRWYPFVAAAVICGVLTFVGLPVQRRIQTHKAARKILLTDEWTGDTLDRVDTLITSGKTLPWRDLQPHVYGSYIGDFDRPFIAYQTLRPSHSDYLHAEVKRWGERTIDARHGVRDEEIELLLDFPEDNPMRLLMEEKFPKQFEGYHKARQAETPPAINQ